MKIPQALPQFNSQPTLLAVVGKETGILYLASDGTVERLEAINEPAATFSDREGFFMRSGGGMLMGTGEPYDGNDVQARHRFIDHVVEELITYSKQYGVKRVYLFEPEHLKGAITKALAKATNKLTVELIDYGNFIHEDAHALVKRIHAATCKHKDPTDPESVTGEEGETEKRKILVTARQVSG